jgi:hypothetical protein
VASRANERQRTNRRWSLVVGCGVADDVPLADSDDLVVRELVELSRLFRFGSAQRFCTEVLRRTLHSGRVQRSRADAREAKPAPCRPAVQTCRADLRYRHALRAACLQSPAAESVRVRSVSRRS